MQTVAELPEFTRLAKKLGISYDEKDALIKLIATDPKAGNEISGTGGVRKLRLAGRGVLSD